MRVRQRALEPLEVPPESTHRVVANVEHSQVRTRLEAVEGRNLIVRHPELFERRCDIFEALDFLDRVSGEAEDPEVVHAAEWRHAINLIRREGQLSAFTSRREVVAAINSTHAVELGTHWHSFNELKDASSLLIKTFFVSKFMPPQMSISLASAATRVFLVSCRQ